MGTNGMAYYSITHKSTTVFFDTLGWVIRPVKTVSCITYIVSVQTLNPAQSIYYCFHEAI